jgi:hypothetical protein
MGLVPFYEMISNTVARVISNNDPKVINKKRNASLIVLGKAKMSSPTTNMMKQPIRDGINNQYCSNMRVPFYSS